MSYFAVIRFHRFLMTSVSCLLAFPTAWGQGPILVANGKSEYSIVSDDHATPPERFAAEELRKYVEMISGVRLPMVSRKTGPHAIWVGRAASVTEHLPGSNEDAYVVRLNAGDLYLAGASPRATLYSVYHFLEKYLGCGWIAPGDDAVPRLAQINLPENISDVESPAFSYRAISLFPYVDTQAGDRLRVNALFPFADLQATKDRIDWAAKSRLNYVHPCVNEAGPALWDKVRSREEIVPGIVKRGLGLHYGGHSYFAWLPPEKYLAAHPDFYAGMKDGKPQLLNIANPKVADTMAGNIAEFLNRNPEISIVTVWMNDAATTCATAECFQMEGPLRLSLSFTQGSTPPILSFSNAALKFTNEVARRLRRTHPNVLVNHLAYNELIDAPTNVKADDNVLIAFAPIQRAPFRVGALAGYFRPLNDPGHSTNRDYLNEIRKWLVASRHFFVWDYYSLWWIFGADRPRWQFPILETMSNDLRFYRKELGLTRVSSEIADWHEENLYAYGRLAWNPDASWRGVLEDFCQRAYGPAAPIMLRHWLLLESAKENWFRQRDECKGHLRQALQLPVTSEVRHRIYRIAALWQESECQKEGDPVGPCKP